MLVLALQSQIPAVIVVVGLKSCGIPTGRRGCAGNGTSGDCRNCDESKNEGGEHCDNAKHWFEC